MAYDLAFCVTSCLLLVCSSMKDRRIMPLVCRVLP